MPKAKKVQSKSGKGSLEIYLEHLARLLAVKKSVELLRQVSSLSSEDLTKILTKIAGALYPYIFDSEGGESGLLQARLSQLGEEKAGLEELAKQRKPAHVSANRFLAMVKASAATLAQTEKASTRTLEAVNTEIRQVQHELTEFQKLYRTLEQIFVLLEGQEVVAVTGAQVDAALAETKFIAVLRAMALEANLPEAGTLSVEALLDVVRRALILKSDSVDMRKSDDKYAQFFTDFFNFMAPKLNNWRGKPAPEDPGVILADLKSYIGQVLNNRIFKAFFLSAIVGKKVDPNDLIEAELEAVKIAREKGFNFRDGQRQLSPEVLLELYRRTRTTVEGQTGEEKVPEVRHEIVEAIRGLRDDEDKPATVEEVVEIIKLLRDQQEV